MALGEMVPWRWGNLRGAREDKTFENFRSDITSLHREMDRLFENLWSEGFAYPLLSEHWARPEVIPQLDISEDDTTYAVKIDLPGMEEKDVDVTLSDRVLTIRGKKEEDKEAKEKNFYRRERAFGSFRRSIEIPSATDVSKIEASFHAGVLTIQLPKTKEAQDKVKRIEVKAA
ncbi:MAG TPA: Hsp20/alpha crystallin family protein [Woeseiaceae bacterium]|nr:Hsp20/alpha crystallin family protein [Woeseiaceae bacterium]